jgi:hypothetical protein
LSGVYRRLSSRQTIDGRNHRERLVEDNRRQNALVNAGYRLLRFTAADIHTRADVVVAEVRAALEAGRTRPHLLNRSVRLAQNVPFARLPNERYAQNGRNRFNRRRIIPGL